MKQYKGAIFDLDGTLLDSMRVWDDIDVAFLKKRGLEVPPDYQEAITPLGFLEAARYTIRRFGFQMCIRDSGGFALKGHTAAALSGARDDP